MQRNKTKKPLASTVFIGVGGTFEDRNNHFSCPVCFDIIDEAHITKCGHSFCHKCIKQSLEKSNRCPKCNYAIEDPEQIYPNFTLDELVMNFKGKQEEKKRKIDHMTSSNISGLLSDDLDLPNINNLLEVLAHKKQKMEADGQFAESCILKEFLQQVRQKKQLQLGQLPRVISILDTDVQTVEDKIKEQHSKVTTCPPSGSSSDSQKSYLNTLLVRHRTKLCLHFKNLEQCYLNVRTSGLKPDPEGGGKELDNFTNYLSKLTRFSSFRPLATLSPAVDLIDGSCIVSSIEFDRDCDFFAIAGVTKKIKVYKYKTVIRDAVDIQNPVQEMLCESQISCVSWSSFHKGELASSDYEGTITLWDANTGSRVKLFQEHEKRCWSVDYNRIDTHILASGSDDCKVKLWSSNSDNSINSLEAKASVCCVKFNPENQYYLAFGSADHYVHYYDLRQTRQPVGVFRGHKKAVSRVQFLNSSEVVSASTDGKLKLWDLKQPNAISTFTGHANEKNFVGLATDGDYIVCGSENNSLYMYYKGLAKHIMMYKFDTARSVEKERKNDETSKFVSAAAWKPGSNVVVAANSRGTVKVLEIV